ncbi:MAG: VIT1/CCC1 transporter family protein [Acidimicrobiia bacterium]
MTAEQSTDQPPGYQPHIGESRQYWRDIILGVNDGLVSIFLLVIGVVGAGLETQQVLVTAVAGALAGAVSMAAGEYLATKSQDEVLNAELTLERQHIRDFKEMELAQLRGFFSEMGVEEDDLDHVVAAFGKSDETLLNAMASLEFGVVESERRSPYLAMAASGLLFLLGSLTSIVPFLLTESATEAIIWAAVLSMAGLFIVGVVKARVAGANWFVAGAENMLIAGIGGLIAWFIGDAMGAVLT